MLVSCANLVNSGVTDLERLVEGLRDRGLSQSLLSVSQQRTLDLIVGDLDERTRALIPYLGALGAGDWSPKMLASIALWTPAEVVAAVQPLVEARLIVRFDTNHYRTTFLLRQYAVGLLDQGDPYRALSAYILLARFCLDQAQDLEAELRTHSSKKGEPSVTLSELDPLFIKEFRRGLTLELPHIRHVLSWAGRKGQWELVRRFSYLPYLETVQHFTADGFEITTSLFMANIWEPTVWPPNRPAFIRIPILEHTEDWTIFPPPMRELSSGDVSVIEGHESSDDLSGDSLPERCRLNWTVIASHIVAAVFRETCLTEARWTGVQARGLILAAGCDAVGAVMQACDLSDSVWVQTDARYARLDGSSLRGALLRHVQLTGASLRGVDFTGAILENVQLRGADLQDADFTGAVLVNTTLRGAQLQQAIFCDAILSYVDLQQAKLNPHQLWQAYTLDKISSEDPEIRQAKGVQKSQRSSNRYQERSNWFAPKQSMPKRHKPPQDLRGYEQKQLQLAEVELPGADLRAVILPEASLEGAFLNGACLRGGSLPKARLNNAKLQGIDGRAIDLRGSTLDDTDLTESNLRDARLQGATLHRAKLVRADLGNADLGEADLSHADLSQCSAPYACWKGARLTNAKLTNARFCYADLQDVDFTGAATDLKAADLTGANLRGATIDLSLLYTTASLSQAILPDGTKVATYRDEYNGQLPHISSDLRFSHWEGQFLLFTLEVEQELDGARLNGIFVNVTFSNLILTNAHLSGNFSGTNFKVYYDLFCQVVI